MKKLLGIGLLSLLLPLFFVQASSAADFFKGCDGISGDATCNEARVPGDKRAAAGQRINNIVKGLLYIVGGLSVIMIIYGGVRFISSRGDANAVQSAKNVVLYAVIGLAVALLASVIATFIGDKLL